MKTLYLLLCACTLAFAGQTIPLDRVVAVVGDDIILESELNEALMGFLQNAGRAIPTGDEFKAMQMKVLESMINDKLLVKEAEVESLTVTDEEVFTARDQRIEALVGQVGSREALERELMDGYGLTVTKLKKNLYRQIKEQMLSGRLTQQLRDKNIPTRKEIEEFYTEYRDSLPLEKESIHLAHIMRKIEPSDSVVRAAEQRIRRIEDELASGKPFEELAKKYSDDPASSQTGGDLGFFQKGLLDPAFERVAFGLNTGEISPPTRSRYGFHLIKLEERKDKSIRVRHILVLVRPDKNDSLRVQLDSLANAATTDSLFEQCARAVSDDKQTKDKGGDLGWVSSENLSPAFKQAIAGLQAGKNSAPVLIDDAYHVFRMLGRKDSRDLTLANDFDVIKQLAANYRLRKEIQSICNRVKRRVYIENRLAEAAGDTAVPDQNLDSIY